MDMYCDRQRLVQMHVRTTREALHDLFVWEHRVRQCGEQSSGVGNRCEDGGKWWSEKVQSMPLYLNQEKGKHRRRRRRTGLDMSLQKQSCPAELQRLSSSRNPAKLATPPQKLSYPVPLRTPCCHTAAGGQDVSALAPLPRCLCCPRCPSGQRGDMGPTGRSKGCWQAADWGGGPHLSLGSPPRRRQDWPDRDPGRWYLLHCWPWERPSVLAAV